MKRSASVSQRPTASHLLLVITAILSAALACSTVTPAPPTASPELVEGATPISNSQSPISLRVEPIIPADLGDRVTGPATVFVDAPGAIRVEVYAVPVDGPFSDTSIGEEKLIGADDTAADSFAVPWPADEPYFAIELYALAYLPGDDRPIISPPMWILLDRRHARATAEAIPIATPAPFTGLPLIVDAADPLGDAAAIADFLAVQGGPGALGQSAESDEYIYNAWRGVMLGVGELSLFDDAGATGARVTRNAQGGLDLDFAGLDAYVNDYFGGTLMTPHIYFGASLMPSALSSNPGDEAAYAFAPADYNEWYDVVYRTVAHIRDNLKMPGVAYMVWTEPETYYLWRGQPGRQPGDPAILNDYIDLYVSTWHAIKSADPSARVGGPSTVTYTSVDYRAQTGWGMEEFLAALAAYNAAQPQYAVTLDEVVWQDYEWIPGSRLADGVAYLRGILPQYGFAADTPQVVMGWNKQFTAGPMCDTITRPQRATYFAANIIEQLNPGGARGLARAYLWPFDDDRACVNTALISVPMPERQEYDYGGYDPTGGDEYGGGILPAITEYRLRPAYAAFQMLRAMRDAGGNFVRMSAAFDSLPPQMIATSNGQQVTVVLVNNSETERQFAVIFHNLPFGGDSAIVTLQQIDETHSNDCNGLEAGTQSRLPLVDGTATASLRLPPYSIVQLTLAPGTFTVDFSDRPEDPTLLMGQYPDDVNGLDWGVADWTTAADPRDGNRYLSVDFPRNAYGRPDAASRIFILPRGKVLQNVSVACPVGATVAFYQPGQEGLIVNCNSELTRHDTGWTSPPLSDIVSLWIDLSAVPDKSLDDVWIDDIVYGD